METRSIFDYVGKIDGVAFDGGSTDGKGTDLVIGSGTYIDNFEEQLVGAHPGDKVEVTVVFPDDYQAADLAGKEAVFKCKVNGIKVKELPEADDEFAQEVSEFDTLDEYKADIKAKLLKDKEDEAKRAKEDAVIGKIVENATMDIPDAMVEYQTQQMLDDFGRRMQSQGLSLEQYFQFTGMTEADYKEQMKPRALQNIQSRLVLEAVAEAEKLEATEEDLEKEYAKMAEQYKLDVDKVKEIFGEYQKEELKKDIVIQKAAELVTEAPVEA